VSRGIEPSQRAQAVPPLKEIEKANTPYTAGSELHVTKKNTHIEPELGTYPHTKDKQSNRQIKYNVIIGPTNSMAQQNATRT
jgi:hypothetical protein